MYNLYKKNQPRTYLLNFNIFGSSEYEKNGHCFETVKFCFGDKKLFKTIIYIYITKSRKAICSLIF